MALNFQVTAITSSMFIRLINATFAKAKLQRANRLAYRKYRLAMLDEQGSVRLPANERASAFREFIVNKRLRASSIDAQELRMIRLGLGIPRYAPLRPHWLKSLGFVLLSMFLPERAAVGLAIRAIRATRTEEGRAYLYSRFLRHLIVGRSNLDSYGEALRLVLTQVNSVRSVDQLSRLASYDEHLLEAGLRLGARDADVLAAALAPLHQQIGAREVLVLVEEQVIERDFACLGPYLDVDGHRFSFSQTISEELRMSVRRLKQAGVPQARLLELVNVDHFAPERLDQVLATLSRHGVSDVATVFEHMGARLWSIEIDALQYVLGVIGATDAATLVQFTEILKEYRAPAPGVAQALMAKGATPAQLAQCQRFLIETGKLGVPVLTRLDILMSLPYALKFEDLDGCGAYLKQDNSNSDRFGDFLAMLAKHRLASKEAILAFGPQFDAIGLISCVDLRLTILDTHFQALPLSEAVAWVRASKGGHEASLRYLGLEVGFVLSNSSDLGKLTNLAKVSPCLLRYLVDERALRTLARLHDWYYREGSGVDAYHGGEICDDTERLLYEDCSKRANFYRLKDNANALVSAVSNWVDGRLGAPGQEREKAVRDRYWVARASFTKAGRRAAAKHIHQILATTEGILLESVLLDGLRGANVATVLQKFAPLTATLLMGESATQTPLTSLEAECIRLVYGASQERIRKLWGQVIGFQEHLQGLDSANPYPVRLRLQTGSLEGVSRTVHDGISRSISALAQAAQSASREDQDATDLLLAAPWKHVGNAAATLADLGPWLAFMLKLGGGSGDVAKWVDEKLAAMQSVLVAPEKAAVIEREFSQFVAATLPDALAEALPAYLTSPAFAARQNELSAIAAKRKQGFGPLQETVKAMVEFVLKVAAGLPRQLRYAMTKSAVDEEFIGHAVVSKHPAAFFARDAFALCSNEDTGMWQEARHSHLLMFDPNRKRLVGMAMLYVQPIPGYAGSKRCLVIRAVNVGTVGLRKFDPVSVLDEIRRIAIEIARANELEAILFPLGCTHFSNQDDILRALPKSQLKKNARRLTLPGGLFYCREQGRDADAVKELQLAWVRSEDGDAMQYRRASAGLSVSEVLSPH